MVALVAAVLSTLSALFRLLGALFLPLGTQSAANDRADVIPPSRRRSSETLTLVKAFGQRRYTSRLKGSKGGRMSEQENVDVVKQGYEAFGRGDIPGLLMQLDANVTWVTPGPSELPTAGDRRGHQGVT